MDTTTLINVGVIGVLVAVVTQALVNRGGRVSDSDVARRLGGQAREDKARAKKGGLVQQAKDGGLEAVAKTLAKPLQGSTYERSKLSLKLAQAGYRQERAVTVFLATKLAFAALGMIGGFTAYAFFGDKAAPWHIVATWVLGGLCTGFYIPQYWLDNVSRSRSRKISRALPDSLDMLLVMVEAGLGMDAAIQRCSDEMGKAYPEIAEEWRIASRETQMGISRSEAMKKMADRTGVSEMQAMVAILTQAERFGTSIATALRVQSESLRTKRRQQAEEAAAKTTVKLMLPLMMFMFPTIGIVVAGPAAMKIARMFANG